MTTERFDDYANFLTGLAGPPDKSSYTFFQRQPRLQREEIESLYEQDAIAARIVDRLVDDAFRSKWSVTGSDVNVTNPTLASDMDDLRVDHRLADAWRQGRLYGGALAVLSVADGRPMDQPLDLASARKITAINVVPSPIVQPQGWGNSALFPFANPEYYDFLLPVPKEGEGQLQARVHHSRVIRFDALSLSPFRMVTYNGWSPSLLQRVYREISQLGETMGYVRSILHDISTEVVYFTGLREQLCGAPGAREQISQMVEQMRMLKDNLHIWPLDAKDRVEERKRTVTGLSEALEHFISGLVRATDMPRTVLLGEQPGGINASNDSEIRSWYDFVDSERKKVLNRALNRVLEIYFRCQANNGLQAPEKWVIEWEPLWQPTAEEKAATAKTEADTAVAYLSAGVVKVEEVRTKLISAGYIDPIEDPGTGTDTKSVGAAPVGVWTGMTALLQAAYPTGTPAEVLAKVLPTLDPERYPSEVASGLFPAPPAPTAIAPAPEVGDPTVAADDLLAAEPEAPPSQEPVPEDLLSTKEAALRLGIPTVTINNLCRSGELAYWGYGKHKQVSLAQVLRLGKSHEESKDLDGEESMK